MVSKSWTITFLQSWTLCYRNIQNSKHFEHRLRGWLFASENFWQYDIMTHPSPTCNTKKEPWHSNRIFLFGDLVMTMQWHFHPILLLLSSKKYARFQMKHYKTQTTEGVDYMRKCHLPPFPPCVNTQRISDQIFSTKLWVISSRFLRSLYPK